MSAAVQASPLNRLAANLEELGLEGMASSVPEYVRLVADGRKGLVDAMLELTDAQISLKRRADDDRRTRMANFPYIKTLADFDWGFQPSVPRGLVEQLATLEFVDRGDNVVLVGSPGVGKTHLSIAIGHEAVMARKQVYFADCSRLVEDLKHASAKEALARRMRFYEHCSLLIIDELGYLDIGKEGADLLFQLVNRRYALKAVDHRHDQRAGGQVGRRVRQQRHGLGGGRQALPPLRDDQDNGTVVPPEGRIHRRRGREGGGSLDAESGASALANPAHPRWRDWRKYVGENGEKYIDANRLAVAYLPGLAASRAAGLFAGEAKTDERDAEVIARTALGVPDSLSGVPGAASPRGRPRLSSQRDHVVACATRDKNRLRAVLLESCPALEAAVDLSDRRWLELLAGFGGAWGSPARGRGAAGRGRREAAAASTAPPPALIEAENRQVRFLAARISEALDEAGALEAETAGLLEGDETYACLLTVPGIGPRTAAQLAVSVDIARFPDHDHLASYCGIAPRVRSSGTSVRSVRASRRGDARLKSLLIFSCNSLVRSSGRYGEYYRACRARGMGHGRALKAVARKRLRAIYAVMRDRVPYRE